MINLRESKRNKKCILCYLLITTKTLRENFSIKVIIIKMMFKTFVHYTPEWQILKKIRLCILACAFNPSGQEAGTGRVLWVQDQVDLHSDFHASQSMRHCLNTFLPCSNWNQKLKQRKDEGPGEMTFRGSKIDS